MNDPDTSSLTPRVFGWRHDVAGDLERGLRFERGGVLLFNGRVIVAHRLCAIPSPPRTWSRACGGSVGEVVPVVA